MRQIEVDESVAWLLSSSAGAALRKVAAEAFVAKPDHLIGFLCTSLAATADDVDGVLPPRPPAKPAPEAKHKAPGVTSEHVMSVFARKAANGDDDITSDHEPIVTGEPDEDDKFSSASLGRFRAGVDEIAHDAKPSLVTWQCDFDACGAQHPTKNGGVGQYVDDGCDHYGGVGCEGALGGEAARGGRGACAERSRVRGVLLLLLGGGLHAAT